MLAKPRAPGAGLAAGVRQLDACNRTLSVDKTGDTLHRFDLFVVPQPEVFGSDAPVRRHRHRFGDDQAGAANGTASQVNQVPVIGQAVDTGILAHRRHCDAIAKGQLAQGIGFKQQAHGNLS